MCWLPAVLLHVMFAGCIYPKQMMHILYMFSTPIYKKQLIDKIVLVEGAL
jgi:hypothetical protein